MPLVMGYRATCGCGWSSEQHAPDPKGLEGLTRALADHAREHLGKGDTVPYPVVVPA